MVYRIFRTISTSLQGVVAGLAIGILGYLALTLVGLADPIRAFVILSGSMEPVIPTGSVVLVREQPIYSPGDVVTFASGGNKKNIVTHRLVGAKDSEWYFGNSTFTTQGDKNSSPDAALLEQRDIVGQVFYSIPYLGYAIDFAKRPQGFILLVIIPATIIIYEELKSVLNEFRRGLEKLRKKQEETSTHGSQPERAGVNPLYIAAPVLVVVMIFAAGAAAYFSDREDSVGNVIGISTAYGPTPTLSDTPSPTPTGVIDPTPTPFPKTLVINEVLPDSSCFQGQTEAQWIELYNNSLSTVDLKDYQISDGVQTISVVNANKSIDPGAFVLLSHNNAIFGNGKCYQDNGADVINLGGSFDIGSGLMQLLDESDSIIDTVQWGALLALNPLQDQSIERHPDGLDSAFGAGFSAVDFVVRATPQPGL